MLKKVNKHLYDIYIVFCKTLTKYFAHDDSFNSYIIVVKALNFPGSIHVVNTDPYTSSSIIIF